MKKLIKIFIGLVVLVFIALLVVWGTLPHLVSSKLSEKAKVPISIEGIQFTPSKISLSKIKVGNPPAYNIVPRALSVNKTKIIAPFTHFFKKKILIEELTMDDIYIGLEFDSKNSKNGNWTLIMNNLNSEANKKDKKETDVLIKKTLLRNLIIEIAYKDTGKKQRLKPIDKIELNNISSSGGIPSSQIMSIVMDQALRNIFSKEGIQNMLQDALSPNDGSHSFMDSLKSIF